MTQFSSDVDVCRYCPECGSDWRHNQIPEDYLRMGLYGKWEEGEERFFSRLVGIYDRDLDRTVRWMCPDCRHTWER